MTFRFPVLAACLAVLPLAAELSAVPAADRFALANALARRGMYAEALKEYDALAGVKSLPADEFLYRRAEALRHLGRTADAAKVYGDLLAAQPASRYADYARLYGALARDGAARWDALQALDRDGTDKALRATARYYLAPHLAESSDPDVRRRALAIYLDLSVSDDPVLAEEATFFAANLSYREKRYTEAAALFTRLLQRFPRGARAKESALYAAWSNWLSGKAAETLRLAVPLRAADDARVSEEAHYLAASALARLERRDEALAAYAAALEKHPTGRYADAMWTARLELLASARAHAEVLAELARRGDPPAASAARAFTFGYEAALAVSNLTVAAQYARRVVGTGDRRLAPYALYWSGAAALREGRSDEALAAWGRLLADYPDAPVAAEALRGRAMEQLRRREYRPAHRSFDELARRFPSAAGSMETLYWRGVAARGAGECTDAEKHLRAALAANPPPVFAREIRLELGLVLQKSGRMGEAARLFAELIGTPTADRLDPARLAAVAEALLAAGDPATAARVAETLEKRGADATWNQIGAALLGDALVARGAQDAAAAAYARALAQDARTDAAARAALGLGRLHAAAGRHEDAKIALEDAVSRAHTPALAALRLEAYCALAVCADARKDLKAALGYHMLVFTLFDDPVRAPPAMRRAAEILRATDRAHEADEILAELKKRYPEAK